MSAIRNVKVKDHGGRFSLSWEHGGARFHVWINAETRELEAYRHKGGCIVYKNPPPGIGRHDPGYFATRKLDPNAAKNAAMIAEAGRIAEAGDMFAEATRAAEAAKLQQEKRDREQARQDRMRQLRDILGETRILRLRISLRAALGDPEAQLTEPSRADMRALLQELEEIA